MHALLAFNLVCSVHIYPYIYTYIYIWYSYLLLHVNFYDSLCLSLSFSIWYFNHSSHLLAFAASHDRSSTLMSQTSVSIPCALFVFLSFLCCVLLFNTLSTSFGIWNHLLLYFVQVRCFCLSLWLAGMISILLPWFLSNLNDSVDSVADPRPKAWKKWWKESKNIIKRMDRTLPHFCHKRSPKGGLAADYIILR